jgi:hypothetical protein
MIEPKVIFAVLGSCLAVAWVAYLYGPAIIAKLKPAARPVQKTGLQTRLDALVSLESLLTFLAEAKNAEGVKAVQDAMAALVKVKIEADK